MGILASGQGEEAVLGREMNKHSDFKAESSKHFLGKSNGSIWLGTEPGTGEGRKKAGKQCWGWVCGIIERPYNLGLRSVDIFSGERETLWKSLGGW